MFRLHLKSLVEAEEEVEAVSDLQDEEEVLQTASSSIRMHRQMAMPLPLLPMASPTAQMALREAAEVSEVEVADLCRMAVVHLEVAVLRRPPHKKQQQKQEDTKIPYYLQTGVVG